MSGLLDDIYSSLPDGSDASVADRRAVDMACGRGAATYGEITPKASATLLRWLRMTSEDVFIDCGSGTGRLVLQAAIETDVRRSIGVEMSGFRHGVALQARAALAHDARQARAAERVELFEGDFRTLVPADASVLYAGSLCFPDVLMLALARACLDAPNFRCLCTLKVLPELSEAQFEQRGGLDLDMTWNANNRLYIYGPKRS